MPKLSTEAKVGLLVLGGSVILLWMTFVVGKFEFGARKGYTITAVFDSVAGLDAKAAVRMAGVKIGSVETIELDDSRAKVTMRILPEVKIKRGSRASIKTMGLMGEKFVEITPPEGGAAGSDPPDPPGQSAYLQEGEQIQITSSPSDVDKLISQLSGIAGDIKQVTASLRQVFGTERGTRSMEDILADLRQTTQNIRDFSHTLNSDGSELVMRLNELTASLNSVVGENRDNLKETMENIREASKNAELALASIEEAAKKVDRGEGTLGKLVTDDSMYNNIDSAAKGLSDYTGRVDRLQTIVSFRSEYMFPDAKSYFTLDLKPKPDKYYTLEVVSDPRYKFSQSIVAATPGGVVTTDTYQDKFLFSLLFVKRWGNLALRLGLMESTGGVGAEYYMLDDKLKLSFDAWNFSSKEPGNENTHAKATVSYYLNKLLFVDAGYDNFLNAGRRAAFVGAGLRFDDEDLKYLIGSVPIPK
jgi:phospholipid/cholesterol/gamma-HCH transport system substrate-binding protein